jgi:hypothetical protein
MLGASCAKLLFIGLLTAARDIKSATGLEGRASHVVDDIR